MQRKMVTLRMSSPWVTVPQGLIGDLRTQPRRPPYNICLRWHVEWDTRCVRSPDSRTPNASLRGIVRSLIRIEVFARRHVPAGTTPGSSVSVVENLVICKPAAHVRTLPFPSSLQVGAFNLITGNNTTETTTRETLCRPGPHPHRSIRTSFDPQRHLHASHRLQPLLHRTLRSHLFSYIRIHVQKHARRPWIGIMWNHRRCFHMTLRR